MHAAPLLAKASAVATGSRSPRITPLEGDARFTSATIAGAGVERTRRAKPSGVWAVRAAWVSSLRSGQCSVSAATSTRFTAMIVSRIEARILIGR